MGFTYQTYPIVGGTVLIIERVQSQNYVPGAAGWAIDADGDAEFNNLVARGSFISGDGTGAHIEINGADAPNGIAFYTGEADETFPGVIQPNHDATELSVTHSSPLVAGHAGASLVLATGRGGGDPDRLDGGAESLNFSGTDDLSLFGGGTQIALDNTGAKIVGGTTIGTAGSKMGTTRFANTNGVTNASSQLVIPHGLPSAPSVVLLGAQSHAARVQGVSATNITVEFRNPATAALVPATNVFLYWLAIA